MLSRIFPLENENAAVKRKRQIDTLKIFNDNVLELQEGVEYQVQFDSGDKRMAILVSLSPEFPLEKPVLRVSPPIIHKWCNEHSEITNAPGLLNFTVHSDLGRVVQAIIREFSKNPPRFVEDNSPVSNLPYGDLAGRASPSYTWKPHDLASTTYNAYYNTSFQPFSSSNATPSIYNYNYTNASNTYNIADQAASKQYVPMGPYPENARNSGQFNATNAPQYTSSPGANNFTNLHYVNANVGPSMQNQVQYKSSSLHCAEFPELDKLTNEELMKLGEEEDLMDEFLLKHTKLKEIDSAVESAIEWVEKTAESNLLKEQELQELRNDVAEKVKEMEALKTTYENLVEKHNELSKVFDPEHIRDCLSKAADASQEQSEVIAQDFLNRKIDVERFLSTYIECRKLGQARRTKEEKLTHQLNELKRSNH
ncbi:vacuolar protein sorting-associated protein 37A [Copidosoma floridanum]|uniref:vacuolar protein sorting-associated protein 37A n=1 Tax=Copidosoma floridanum TaxID=29053 RepID=UPI0006C970E1|nr:vacuolar protein sorting-associated protein 37A [Copidosoma floridanum]